MDQKLFSVYSSSATIFRASVGLSCILEITAAASDKPVADCSDGEFLGDGCRCGANAIQRPDEEGGGMKLAPLNTDGIIRGSATNGLNWFLQFSIFQETCYLTVYI